jgi:virulence factor Mce-like protein
MSVFGLLLFLWLSFGGAIPFKPKGYRFNVSMPEATQLAEQADVRVAGVNVGKVVGKQRDPAGNRTLVTVQLDGRYAPLRRDARAILRQKTLLGETYVELTTGSRRAGFIPEGGRLANSAVVPTVELDELLEIFEPTTRRAFRLWQREQARATAGRAMDINDALGTFPSFNATATSLLEVLHGREGALRSQIRNTGVTFQALTANEGQLRNLITSSRQLFVAVASERNNLAEAIRIFPTFLDETRLTLARLQRFAVRTDPLLVELEPTLRDLRPTLVSLNALSPDLRKLFQDLDPLIEASATGLPALERILRGVRPTLAALGPFLEELNPILEFLGVNQQVVSDFISIGGGALGNREPTRNPNGTGHVLPQLIMIGDQSILTRRRVRSNRGNSYLENGVLFGERHSQAKQILPNWDCQPSNGEQGPGRGEPVAGFNGNPACFVQGPYRFKGQRDRYPHVRSEDYGDDGQ